MTLAEAKRSTLYQIVALFKLHREYNPDRFQANKEAGEADIDDIFMGL